MADHSANILLVSFVVYVLIYFLPAIMGSTTGHRRTVLLWFTNLTLGWTVIGWLACLYWAVHSEPRFQQS